MNQMLKLMLLGGLFAALFAPFALRADTIEMMNGTRLQGTVTKVDAAARMVDLTLKLGSRFLERRYPFAVVHAVTVNGARQVITPKAGSAPAAPSASATGSAPAGAADTRTQQQVEAIIQSEGATEPPWLSTTKLVYPASLDLAWPEPPPEKGWNSQKNVGQFIWDVINPNENRWREGVRFMYFLLDRHQNNAATRARVMRSLASMYFRFFQDYPRAAYWWRQGLPKGGHDETHLAECYFRLGNKPMAMARLTGKSLSPDTIKLLGAMGETDRAVKAADAFARASDQPHWALLAAGDALSLAGRHQEAIQYYQRVIDEPKPVRNKEYEQRLKGRARESIEAIRLFELADLAKVRDGAYTASATGYNGPLKVEARVSGGRAVSVRVVQHREKQYYSALRDVPDQILARQSLKDIDATSGATITAKAIVNAAARAVGQGGAR